MFVDDAALNEIKLPFSQRVDVSVTLLWSPSVTLHAEALHHAAPSAAAGGDDCSHIQKNGGWWGEGGSNLTSCPLQCINCSKPERNVRLEACLQIKKLFQTLWSITKIAPSLHFTPRWFKRLKLKDTKRRNKIYFALCGPLCRDYLISIHFQSYSCPYDINTLCWSMLVGTRNVQKVEGAHPTPLRCRCSTKDKQTKESGTNEDEIIGDVINYDLTRESPPQAFYLFKFEIWSNIFMYPDMFNVNVKQERPMLQSPFGF